MRETQHEAQHASARTASPRQGAATAVGLQAVEWLRLQPLAPRDPAMKPLHISRPVRTTETTIGRSAKDLLEGRQNLCLWFARCRCLDVNLFPTTIATTPAASRLAESHRRRKCPCALKYAWLALHRQRRPRERDRRVCVVVLAPCQKQTKVSIHTLASIHTPSTTATVLRG